MIIATLRGAPAGWLDMLAAAWLATRLGYTGVYLADLYKVRPALWALSVAITSVIFLLAGWR